MRLSLVSAALVAALVGFGSTIALVLAAAAAVGASPAQTASWVLAVCLAKAVGSAFLGWYSRVPVVLAWSTPGAALIAASTGISINQAVAAFLVAGGLTALTGAIKPLGKLVAMIPDGIAAGMLAGVLLPFVLRLMPAMQGSPAIVLPVVLVFAMVRLWNPSFAVLAALGLGLFLGLAGGHFPDAPFALPTAVFIAPEWNLSVMLGLGLPIYLVTMAAQNLPGFATLRAAGFEPPVRPALVVTGGLSAISALFGAHPVNMAAITAAICLGDDVHPDRSQRWKVSLAYGAIWLALGLFSPLVILLIGALPAELVTAIVALALFGPLTGALAGAFAHPSQRFAAAVTLVVTASGVTFFGIGAAFWGLLTGIIIQLLEHGSVRLKAR
ncbi:MAG: benzoate transporter [Cereibacter sphaeroides]|uniref:Benzoate transporter n=1 Tax=Cereibacter sphaeroides TaxID=1063 RepID=A0A2W5S1M6_CERSP|nr:MAG: benzoate transporter [Cereibacter sphaeroides]